MDVMDAERGDAGANGYDRNALARAEAPRTEFAAETSHDARFLSNAPFLVIYAKL